MMTVEIKINGRVIEVVEIVQMQDQEIHVGHDESSDPGGLRLYQVNGVYEIVHRRSDGHRVLARKALDAIKRMKR